MSTVESGSSTGASSAMISVRVFKYIVEARKTPEMSRKLSVGFLERAFRKGHHLPFDA